jgi:hypothetical protein
MDTPLAEAPRERTEMETLADKVTKDCGTIVGNLNRYKQDRLNRIALYRELYAGKVRRSTASRSTWCCRSSPAPWTRLLPGSTTTYP